MAHDSYGPRLGAHPHGTGTRFALWTDRASACAVRLQAGSEVRRTVPMLSSGEGFFEVDIPGVGHGGRYTFVLDGEEVRDPFASWLPDGVGGPAMVWRAGHRWKHEPPSRPLREQVLYELHVGTFTPQGTYAAAAARLPALAELGVSAVELMPVGAFPGLRGWGYDVVAHYAPFAPYGDPDELRAFVDAAHGLGIAVILDVVYNHFGPSGNVLARYSREYFTSRHRTPWGDSPNFEHHAMRRYVVRNALAWLEEFRMDGLRLDAVHTIQDDSSKHVLSEIADVAAELRPKRWLVAEDDRNDPRIVEEEGFDGVWADDFHHQARVALTRERDGYYACYSGSADDLASTIEHGFFYRGAAYPLTGEPRGKEAPNLPAEAFVYCIQNHDQIGNRAFGDRLTERASLEAFSAASMLLLFLPMTPLLFMGQEWAATTPFLYFTHHDEELGRLVTEGRRKEFARFEAFADGATRARVPDPQSAETFERSRLDWSERDRPERARVLGVVREMLRLRRADPVLRGAGRAELRASASGALLVVDRWLGDERRRLVWNLGEAPAAPPLEGPRGAAPSMLLRSEGGEAGPGEPLAAKAAVLFAARSAGAWPREGAR